MKTLIRSDEEPSKRSALRNITNTEALKKEQQNNGLRRSSAQTKNVMPSKKVVAFHDKVAVQKNLDNNDENHSSAGWTDSPLLLGLENILANNSAILENEDLGEMTDSSDMFSSSMLDDLYQFVETGSIPKTKKLPNTIPSSRDMGNTSLMEQFHSQIEELNQVNTNISNALKKERTRNKILMEQRGEDRERIKELIDMVKELTGKIDRTQGHGREEYEDKEERMEIELESLRDRLATVTEESTVAEELIKVLEERVKKMTDQCSVLEDKLKTEMELRETEGSELVDARKEIEGLRDKLLGEKQQYDSLMEEFEECKKSLVKHEDTLRVLQETESELQAGFEARELQLQDEIAKLEQQSTLHCSQLQELQEEYNKSLKRESHLKRELEQKIQQENVAERLQGEKDEIMEKVDNDNYSCHYWCKEIDNC